MKRITKDMVKAGGHRYCCECAAHGPRVKARWTHKGRDYCDMHKPAEMVKQPVREAPHWMHQTVSEAASISADAWANLQERQPANLCPRCGCNTDFFGCFCFANVSSEGARA